MKGKTFKKLAAIVSAAALMTTIGITAFAEDATTTAATTKDSGKTAIWNILTDDQKAQLVSDAKAKLDQNLADGKITQEQYDSRKTAIESGEMPMSGKGGRQMTEEQKAAKEAQKAKWDALTDAQKAEIYSLYDQKAAIDSKIIDKYLEYGVIDSDTAATMKENVETRKSDMRTNGRMPMCGKGGRGNKTSSEAST